jgi:hypothetical protein
VHQQVHQQSISDIRIELEQLRSLIGEAPNWRQIQAVQRLDPVQGRSGQYFLDQFKNFGKVGKPSKRKNLLAQSEDFEAQSRRGIAAKISTHTSKKDYDYRGNHRVKAQAYI